MLKPVFKTRKYAHNACVITHLSDAACVHELIRQITGNDSSVPEPLRKAWKDAVNSKSRSSKTALFQKFLDAGGDWGMCHGLSLP